jgi:hypothetical protein
MHVVTTGYYQRKAGNFLPSGCLPTGNFLNFLVRTMDINIGSGNQAKTRTCDNKYLGFVW